MLIALFRDSAHTKVKTRRNVVYWNPNGRSSMISCAIKSFKRQSQGMSLSAFLCFNGLENFDIFYIRHNNIHGNDLLDSSVVISHSTVTTNVCVFIYLQI